MTRHTRWAALLLGLVFGALTLAQNTVPPAQTAVLTSAAVVTEVNGAVQVRIAPRALRVCGLEDKPM